MVIPSLDTIANGLEVAMFGLFIWLHKRSFSTMEDKLEKVDEKIDDLCISITKLWTEHNIYKSMHQPSHKEDNS